MKLLICGLRYDVRTEPRWVGRYNARFHDTKKLTMKNHLYKAALAAALGLAGATAAHAQVNPNDLVLGFTSQFGGVSNDYIVDLGQLPPSSGYMNTSSFSSSAFASAFTTSSGNALTSGTVNVGIVGGNDGNSVDVFDSTLDTSLTPSASTPGSNPPGGATPSNISAAAAVATSLSLGTVAQSSPTSFFYSIAENPMTPGSSGVSSFAGYVSNPLSTINGSDPIITLDLWEDSQVGAHGTTGWDYEGYVELNLTGGNLTASFDSPVPEPSTYCLYGVGGLLMFAVRRKLSAKVA
jgi:hypothetical protein